MNRQPETKQGRVRLVGAGPGAADLLTLRAVRAIESADVILYDALVGEDALAFAKPEARLIPVGKRGHRGSVPQDFTNRLMARLALEGEQVVRLKGGDPSVFGRAAEERAFLEGYGVDVEVIPGVTTASAAAAAFDFSLTERGMARRVLFATGRTMDGAAEGWAAVDPDTTLCLYMACADIAGIATELLAAGHAPETPVLVAMDIERPGQRCESYVLSELKASAPSSNGSPALVIVGQVVRNAGAVKADARKGGRVLHSA